jgi:AcrR family transcriptional regulator
VSGAKASTAALPTRERLLAATLELLSEGGYAAASVIAITARAGVASGTLYRHFGSKEELFVELFREVCGREVLAMYEAASREIGPLDQLDAAVGTFAQRALENPRVAWALLAEPVDPLVDAERLDYRRRYRDLVATLLVAASKQGQVVVDDPDLLAAAIVGGVGEALVGPLSAGKVVGAHARQRLLAQIADFTLNATGARR